MVEGGPTFGIIWVDVIFMLIPYVFCNFPCAYRTRTLGQPGDCLVLIQRRRRLTATEIASARRLCVRGNVVEDRENWDTISLSSFEPTLYFTGIHFKSFI